MFCLVFSFVLIRIQQLYLKKKKPQKKTQQNNPISTLKWFHGWQQRVAVNIQNAVHGDGGHVERLIGSRRAEELLAVALSLAAGAVSVQQGVHPLVRRSPSLVTGFVLEPHDERPVRRSHVDLGSVTATRNQRYNSDRVRFRVGEC